MAFGQQGGPPATGRQVQELLELLHGAGHSDFRDARGPMGFNQRQAGGRFTRDEAEVFIGRLQEEASRREEEFGQEEPGEKAPPRAPEKRPTRAAAPRRSLSTVPDDQLAAELRSRGWTVGRP